MYSSNNNFCKVADRNKKYFITGMLLDVNFLFVGVIRKINNPFFNLTPKKATKVALYPFSLCKPIILIERFFQMVVDFPISVVIGHP